MDDKKIDPVVATGLALIDHSAGIVLLFNRLNYVPISVNESSGEFRPEPEMSAALLVTAQMVEQMHALLGQWLDQHRVPPPEAKLN